MNNSPTADYANYTEVPADPDMLEPEDRALLDIDHLQLWPLLNRDGRAKLLKKLRKAEPRKRQARERERERHELGVRYIELLCSLPRPGQPGYTQAFAEFAAVKRAYDAIRGKSTAQKKRIRENPITVKAD